ncbi:hypothetical protein DFJ58DRAFT_727275 [Suillus subalutaceus]|uniref:uncharacterized protein n=1 Tax=Suillus subalutaceus TaxID=48586 RepID=UPI001B873FC6|nr:uncharacterized protein DFJ58DRAFT_727275 [Suillus subalutaceus]KAG1856021.1 hypothetical protein DFJ58DRAFT_727275 [Suillus subalutaceus]
MAPPVSPRRTRPANATRHPGLVLLEGQKKRCTKAQVAEDKGRALEAQAAKEAALQRGVDRIAGIEAAMQVEQVAEATSRAKPVKPRTRPVKKKEKQQDETNELALEHPSIPPAQAKVQGAGSQHPVDSVGGGNGKVVENEAAGNEEVKMKKKKKVNPTVSREAISAATRQIIDGDLVQGKADSDKKGNLNPSSTLRFMTLTWGLRSKKYSLTGKVNNWCTHLEPEPKAAAKPFPVHSIHTETVSVDSLGISLAKSSQTVATTVSLAKDPPLSLTDSSETSHAPALDEDGDDDTDIDTDDEEDNNNKFKEHFVANTKGKAREQMQSVVAISGEIAEHSDDNSSEILPVSTPFNLLPFTQQAEIVQFALEQAQSTRTGSSSKQPIEAVDLITSSEEDSNVADEDNADASFDAMVLNATHFMSPEVEPAWVTSKTSVTVCKNANPPKKIKLEPATKKMDAPVSPEPSVMSADMMTKPKSGNQWRNTDLPPLMLEDGMWRRSFIPTVFLWAGAQPNFWSIETEKLLPALQAIFNVAYPGMNHKVQPRGPIIGLVNQRICSWRSNFGSTAIALVANFLATSKDNEDEDEDEDEDANFEQTLAAELLQEWAFLYEDPEVRDPGQIYRKPQFSPQT